jgi:hypothetical protein
MDFTHRKRNQVSPKTQNESHSMQTGADDLLQACLAGCGWLRAVAGALNLVSGFDLSLSPFTLITQTLLFYTLVLLLNRLPSLAVAVLDVCTVLAWLCTTDYLKSSTHSSNVHLTLICFITLLLLLQVCLLHTVCLACLLHTDTPHIHTCQRHHSREQLALFLKRTPTTLRSFSCLLHVNWTIVAWLVLDCLRN